MSYISKEITDGGRKIRLTLNPDKQITFTQFLQLMPIIWSGSLGGEPIIVKQLSDGSHIANYEFMQMPLAFYGLKPDVASAIFHSQDIYD
jgi:hypothetical protein